MIREIAAVAVVAAAFGTHAGAETPADFAWRLPLATPGSAAYYRVELPIAVYEHALRADLADVRVFDGDGAPVPIAFLVPPEPEREAVAPVALPFFPLRVDAQRAGLGDLSLTLRRNVSGTRVDVTAGNGDAVRGERLAGYLVDASYQATPLVALVLSLPSGSNVTTRVRVDGSDDLATWRPLADNAVLMAAEANGRRIARERVALAALPAKYLRVSFLTGAPAPVLAGVRGEFGDRVTEAPRQWRDATFVADADRPGEFGFDLGGHFPVDRIRLTLPEINTVAPAQLFVRAGPQDPWSPVAAGVFYRLRRDGGESLSPPLAVPPTAVRYWKLAVDAGALGARTPELSAGWIARPLVFAARGNGPFELAYGSALAKPAALPIATLVPDYDRRTSPASFGVASVGAAQVAPAMAALRAPIDRKRWLLWAALALATIVLGAMALQLTRDMRGTPAKAADAAGDGG